MATRDNNEEKARKERMMWRVLDSEYIARRPWMTARRDRVQLPNGTVHPEYYVLEYPDWVNVIAITRDGRFVMVEQYRHGLRGVFTELCAGVIEEGETPLEAAKRELQEETGYVGGTWELLAEICANPSCNNNITHCFLARDVVPAGERHLDATEDINVRLLTEDELLEMLCADEMKQALMLAPLWKYFAEKRRKNCSC